jgi:hypothetical protein
MHLVLQFTDLVAAATPAPKPLDDDKVSPGWIGLILLITMGGAVVLLVRSMQKRLRNIDVDRHRRETEARRQAEQKDAPAPIADDAPEPDKN